MNLNLASQALRWLSELGVQEIIVCAGARNAPLVYALEGLEAFAAKYFFEERSAGFYGVGRILSEKKPVALMTTSGTAVAELFPAVIEAYYQSLPLIIVTADRPRSHRGKGTPQGIEQVGIFGDYVEACLDVEPGGQPELSHYTYQKPLHLNLCFDEPLLANERMLLPPWPAPKRRNTEAPPTSFSGPLNKPLVLVSELPEEFRSSVHALLAEKKWPTYLEATSGLSAKDLNSWESEAHLRQLLKEGAFDGVLRFGSVPTSRLWRDLEKMSWPVWSFSHRPFTGLGRAEAYLQPLTEISTLSQIASLENLRESAVFRSSLERLFEKYPQSEPAWMHQIFMRLPQNARLYVGNSLPIREWDLVWDRRKILKMFSHRGANGIDGQISSFLGICAADQQNFAVLGDLTSLYDMAGFWAHRAAPAVHAQVVVMNNGGGQIFSRFFEKKEFLNEHDLNFKPLAQFWNWSYQKVEAVTQWDLAVSPCLVEIVPNSEQTSLFWKEFGGLK